MEDLCATRGVIKENTLENANLLHLRLTKHEVCGGALATSVM